MIISRRNVQLLLTFCKASIFPLKETMKWERIRRDFCTRNNWLSKREFQENTRIAGALPGSTNVNTAYLLGRRIAGTPGSLLALLGLILPELVLLGGAESLISCTSPGSAAHHLAFLALRIFRAVLVTNVLFNTFNLKPNELNSSLGMAVLILGSLAISVMSIDLPAVWLILTDLVVLLFFGLHRLQHKEGIVFVLAWLYLMAAYNLKIFLLATLLSGAAITGFILNKEGRNTSCS